MRPVRASFTSPTANRSPAASRFSSARACACVIVDHPQHLIEPCVERRFVEGHNAWVRPVPSLQVRHGADAVVQPVPQDAGSVGPTAHPRIDGPVDGSTNHVRIDGLFHDPKLKLVESRLAEHPDCGFMMTRYLLQRLLDLVFGERGGERRSLSVLLNGLSFYG